MPKLKVEMGAEPKKVAILGGLLLLAAYLVSTRTSWPVLIRAARPRRRRRRRRHP
ncbi:MAG: hypothetical protein MZV70_19310 [Desulfobacterales bacterium]|nr:hypothetical protein [Desulfobacterales bacterium]